VLPWRPRPRPLPRRSSYVALHSVAGQRALADRHCNLACEAGIGNQESAVRRQGRSGQRCPDRGEKKWSEFLAVNLASGGMFEGCLDHAPQQIWVDRVSFRYRLSQNDCSR
jgi:hypothetical protein